MAEERIDLGLDEDELDPPEPQQRRPAPQRAEEDDDLDGDGGGFWQYMGGVVARVLAVMIGTTVVVMIAYAAFNGHRQIVDIREKLAAKANSADVAQEIARLDSVKANRSDLDSTYMMINGLTDVTSAHNTRLAEAVAKIKKVSDAASAASRRAKEASQIATDSRNRLDQLVRENESWLGKADRQLDTLRAGLADSRREMDSRVGLLAVGISDFRVEQSAVNAAQDSAITLFKLSLGERKLRRLAAELEKKNKKEEKKRD